MIDKNVTSLFPTDRPYTEVEAVISFEIDRNNGCRFSYSGYATLWVWNRDKVTRFIKRLQSSKGLTRIGNRELRNPVHAIHRNNTPGQHSTDTLNPAMAGDRAGQSDTQPTSDQHYYKTNTKKKSYCPEQSSMLDDIQITLKDGSEYIVTADYLSELEEAYQGLDTIVELRKCRQWNLDNPKKRKTRYGIKKHINSWMSKANTKAFPNHNVKNKCRICRYYNEGKCENLSKPGYPENCNSYQPTVKN